MEVSPHPCQRQTRVSPCDATKNEHEKLQNVNLSGKGVHIIGNIFKNSLASQNPTCHFQSYLARLSPHPWLPYQGPLIVLTGAFSSLGGLLQRQYLCWHCMPVFGSAIVSLKPRCSLASTWLFALGVRNNLGKEEDVFACCSSLSESILPSLSNTDKHNGGKSWTGKLRWHKDSCITK